MLKEIGKCRWYFPTVVAVIDSTSGEPDYFDEKCHWCGAMYGQSMSNHEGEWVPGPNASMFSDDGWHGMTWEEVKKENERMWGQTVWGLL